MNVYNMDKQLLNLIGQCPELYDKSCVDYKSLLKKEAAWMKISDIMQMTVLEAKSRYKSLREKYQREKKLKELNSRNGSKSNNRQEWSLFKYFQFLEATSFPRSNAFQSPSDPIDVSHNLEFSQNTPDSDNSEYSSSNVPKKRKFKQNVEQEDDQLVSVLKSIADTINVVAGNTKLSKYENFTKYLLSELATIPEEDADEFIDNITTELLTLKQKIRDKKKNN